MGTPAPAIMWHDSSISANDALSAHIASVLGVAPDSIRTGRICGECGSDQHGRPWATGGVHISLSRSGPHLLTAVSSSGPIGVDVESCEAFGTADQAPLEAREWVRKEAILKLTGLGLAVPMSAVHVADFDVIDLAAPDGFCAALAT